MFGHGHIPTLVHQLKVLAKVRRSRDQARAGASWRFLRKNTNYMKQNTSLVKIYPKGYM